MLVKESIVHKWYKKENWVHKNFSYLFQNPLWNKKVPAGFSVCPYFWMSMFSLFIFRPFFITPMKYIFQPIGRLIGPRIHKFDEKVMGLVGGDTRNVTTGIGLMLTALFFLLAALGIFTLSVFGGLLVSAYQFLAASGIGKLFFWGTLGGILVSSVVKIHKEMTGSECKSQYYILAYHGLLAIVAAILFPLDILYSLKIVGGIIAGCVIGLGMSFKFLGGLIWMAIKSLFSIFYAGPSILGVTIPWIVFLILIGGVGFLLSLLLDKFFDDSTNQTTKKPSTKDDWANYLSDLFFRYYSETDLEVDCRYFCDNIREKYPDKFKDASRRATYNAVQKLAPQLAAINIKANLDHILGELEGNPTILTDHKKFKISGKYGVHTLVDRLTQNIRNLYDVKIEGENEFLLRRSLELMVEGASSIQESVELVTEEAKVQQIILDEKKRQEEERSKKIKNTWHHKWCIKVTTKMESGAKAVTQTAVSVWNNVKIFVAYMWMLIKAKKQKACPYFLFYDEDDNQNNKNNQNTVTNTEESK